MSIDIEVVARATSVLTKETLGIGLLNRSLELEALVPKLTTAVDVGGLGTHAESDNEGAFDKFVGVVTEDFSVLASTRLGLISIDDEVRRSVNVSVGNTYLP